MVVMGPTMNILLAVLLLTGLYKFHFQKPAFEEQPARVGDVEADSPASQSGLKPGDLVVRLDGLQNPKWEDVEIKILTTVGEAMPLEIDREGKNPEHDPYAARGRAEPDRVCRLVPVCARSYRQGRAGASCEPGGANARRPDRGCRRAEGSVLAPCRLSAPVRQGEAGPTFNPPWRPEIPATLKPVLTDVMGEKRWRIGVYFSQRHDGEETGLGGVPSRQPSRTICGTASLGFDVLGKILTRRLSTRSLAGPIGIAQALG